MIKKKWVYSGYGITFDGEGLWNFDNDFAKNIVIFGVGNSSSYHPDNRKNNFLVLGEGLAYVINRTLVSPGKMFVLILVKQTQNSAWFCIIMVIIVIGLLMEKKSLSLKLIIKMLTN